MGRRKKDGKKRPKGSARLGLVGRKPGHVMNPLLSKAGYNFKGIRVMWAEDETMGNSSSGVPDLRALADHIERSRRAQWHMLGEGSAWREPDGALLQAVGHNPAHAILRLPHKPPLRLYGIDPIYDRERALTIVGRLWPAWDTGEPVRMMRRALQIAAEAPRTDPNPTVGAVVVFNGQIVGQGATEPPPGRHAEVVALEAAGEAAQGATLYTTLEPCNTHGRTPPCTDAIRRAGVAMVVVGASDPSQHGSGPLRAQGVATVRGVLAEECYQSMAAFMERATKRTLRYTCPNGHAWTGPRTDSTTIRCPRCFDTFSAEDVDAKPLGRRP